MLIPVAGAIAQRRFFEMLSVIHRAAVVCQYVLVLGALTVLPCTLSRSHTTLQRVGSAYQGLLGHLLLVQYQAVGCKLCSVSCSAMGTPGP
jgi:hypothetical protein